ncbi:hypothetical protein BDD12DRAFT_494359 [Trichophaea hybrida]|nr:hypothetical protein BDD12DRAFT_494359 [Trichophaea hybrida]
MGDAGPLVEEEDVDDDDLYSPGRQPSAATPSSSASSSAKPKAKTQSGPSARVRTLGDLGSRDDDSEEEDEKKRKRDLFAGGEKSGLAVQDPGDPSAAGHGNLIQDILKRAAEGGQRRRQDEEQQAAPPTRFSGSGHTLGSDTTASVVVPDPVAATPAPRENVTRTLTFWRNGFSVEDGPLMRYDDPANREILQAIENGRAPMSVMNVAPGQPADVSVFKRLDEDYIPPKKRFVPFSGHGQRLGSLTPGESLAAAAPPAAQPATSTTHVAATSVNIDSSAPTTSLQIRLGDGTRLVSRFNHSHTVGDLYNFVNSSSSGSRNRSYVLQTTFPNKELKEMEQTIKDAGLINAVVVQKWST